MSSRGTSPRAAIDADALRLLVHAGRVYPDHGWNDEKQLQWDTAMDLWKAMVRVYRNREIDRVVDLYPPPCSNVEGDAFMAESDMRRNLRRFPALRTPVPLGQCARQRPLSVEETVDAIESLIS